VTTLLAMLFLGLLVVTFTVVVWFTRPGAGEKNAQERLSTIRRTLADGEQTNKGMLNEAPKEGLASRVGAHLKGYAFTQSLELLIQYADSRATVGSVVLTSIGLAVAAGLAVNLFVHSATLIVLGALVGGSIRYLLLRFKKGRRLSKFGSALPDAIELMARALSAGHSMGSCIEVVAEQSPQPLAGEFDICFQQQKFGIPFRDALLDMAGRVPLKDLHFLVTAILVQKETGGDLTEILNRTTNVIRERSRIEGEVKTYTAQGRLTGWILGLMPVVMLGLINFMTPGYSHVLFYDPLGHKLLYAAAALIALGGFVISRIVDIKV
jgi:tight adherence protein B